MSILNGIGTGAHPDIVLASLTLSHLDAPDFIRLAHKAGFKGVSARLGPQIDKPDFPLPAGSPQIKSARKALDETGLTVLDVESIRIGADFEPSRYEPFFESAAYLGARYALTVSDVHNDTYNADKIAALAELAACYGLALALEFMTYVGIRSVEHTQRIIDMVGRNDTRLLVDALHLSRSGGTPADIAKADPRRISYAQLCDAPATLPSGDFAEIRKEARGQRLLPGDGDLPLVDFLKALPKGTILSVEAPVKDHARTDEADLALASRALAGVRRLLEKSGYTA